MEDLIGRMFGHYRLDEQLGVGGMATIYKAWDSNLERVVAVKVLQHPTRSLSDNFRKRFTREAKALAQLSHPNIVPVHDFGEEGGIAYLVMAYVPGGDLTHLMGKTMAPEQAAVLLLPIARALAYAHQHGIVHRDVKPANLLMSEAGEPLLSDFGIARLLENEMTGTLTATGAIIGTPAYMSPEQALGEKVDGRADIYALGVVLYELVTGHRPYTAPTPVAMLQKKINQPLPDPRQYVKQLQEPVVAVLEQAMAANPEERYANMEAFIADLDAMANQALKSTARIRRKKKTPPKPKTVTPDSTTQPSAGGGIPRWVWVVAVVGLVMFFAVLAAVLFTSPGGEIAAPATALVEVDTQSETIEVSSGPNVDSAAAAAPSPTTVVIEAESTKLPTATSAPTPTHQQAGADYQMAFASDRGGVFEVYLADPDQASDPNNWTELPRPPSYSKAWWPSFCGERWVFYEASTSNGQWIFYVDLDTMEVTAWEPPNDTDFLGVPRCSPDNAYMAYSTKLDPSHIELHVVDESNTDIFSLRNSYSPVSEAFISGYVSWSMDNSSFLSMANPARDSTYKIYKTDNFGTTSYIDDGMYPAISPDGTQMAYMCNGNMNLCVGEIGNAQPITDVRAKTGMPGATPMWSPDGIWVYFASAHEGDFDIYRIKPDGSDLENLTDGSVGNELMPVLQW